MPASTNAAPAGQSKFPIPIGLLVGIIALIVVMMLPTPEGLSTSGQRMLAILTFAVIVWVTEAVSYEVSSLAIMALIAFLVGYSPRVTLDPATKGFVSENADKLFGTGAGLNMALTGFSNSAWWLVAGATFLAAAMTYTGLDRRIALYILKTIGTSTKRILIGIIIVTIVLSLFVPSATARVACVVPIMSGIIAAYGVEKRSRIAVGIMIMVAQATSVWNVGIQTAAAQNLLTTGFMQTYIGKQVTWFEWLIAGTPWSILMSIVLYFVVLKLMPPEADNVPGGKEAVEKELQAMGAMPGPQKRLLFVTLCLLFLWATGGILHKIDTSTSTTAGLVLLMLPRIGVINWKEVQKRTPWGTILVFGVGISLGGALLNTGAGKWLGDWVVNGAGLSTLSPFMIFAIMAIFLIVIHLGFASATAMTSLFMPIMIVMFHAIGQTNASLTPQIQLGLSMLLGFVVSFGFVLPINAPQNMVCLGTETFTAKEFSKIGIPLTIAGYVLMLIMALTYWPLLGWL